MTIPIEQAIYSNAGGGGYRFAAQSDGFDEHWLAEAERICMGFGERPPKVSFSECMFAQPFGPRHAAVVQVADQGQDDAGRPGALTFRLLVLPMADYTRWLGDPFAIADAFPADWKAQGRLETLAWSEPLPKRTVAQIQEVLKTGDSPTLLGGVQALIDSGRMVYERDEPAPELVRSIWMLLPHSTRAHLWPATFAFSNTLDLHVLVVPHLDPQIYDGYLTEDQAGDYPQGRYELNLQIAVEDGDQRSLDALFARRSSTETFKLALIILGFAIVLAVIGNWPVNKPIPPKPKPKPEARKVQPPLQESYPALTEKAEQQLRAALLQLAKDLEVEAIPKSADVNTLLVIMDKKLGTPNPQRDPGDISEQGGPERRLRVLLWKHEVERFDDEKLNVVELVEQLATKVIRRKPQ